jgi:hypothetical protein
VGQTPQQLYELSRKHGVAGYEDMPVVEDLRLFEVEVGGGVNFGRKWGEAKPHPGTNLIAELRLNRPEPWDIALQFKGANFKHTTAEDVSIKTTIINPSLFVDYNIRPHRRTRFFAGVGIGGNFSDSDAYIPAGVNSFFWIQEHGSAFAVTPRVGVSVFNFVRITVEYTATARDYSRWGVNIGLVLGGSYKSPYVDRRSGKQKFWEDTAPAIINSIFP